MSGGRWDQVVVGGGSSGAALAARLAEDPGRRVLLLEAGPDPGAAEEVPAELVGRATSDAGTPVVESEPNGPHAAIYRTIGAKVRDQLQGAIAAA